MPCPVRSRLAHSVASRAGTGLSGDSTSAASSAAMISPNPPATTCRGLVGGAASIPRRGNSGVPVSSRSASMTSRCSPALRAVSLTLT